MNESLPLIFRDQNGLYVRKLMMTQVNYTTHKLLIICFGMMGQKEWIPWLKGLNFGR